MHGGPDAASSPGIQLGKLAEWGKRGVLRISGADMLRLRWNPLYSYVESKILRFMALAD